MESSVPSAACGQHETNQRALHRRTVCGLWSTLSEQTAKTQVHWTSVYLAARGRAGLVDLKGYF